MADTPESDGPYMVWSGDRAGPAGDQKCDTFAEALEVLRAWKKERPDNMFGVVNLDRYDYDTDGLTSEQREQLEEI